MEATLRARLLDINRDFYAQHASSFSATRGRVQPGVRLLLPDIERQERVLDLGCGNGTLARALANRDFAGHYLGVDQSQDLLTAAKFLLGKPSRGRYHFRQANLAEPGWEQALPPSPANWLVSFATLHHLPGEALRTRTVQTWADLIVSDGRVAVSVWQWHHSPRLRQRVVPWEKVGVDPAGLDEGDVLLDWRAGGQVGFRYVYTFTEASLASLAESAGFSVVRSFYSDGHTKNLALYQVWGLGNAY